MCNRPLYVQHLLRFGCPRRSACGRPASLRRFDQLCTRNSKAQRVNCSLSVLNMFASRMQLAKNCLTCTCNQLSASHLNFHTNDLMTRYCGFTPTTANRFHRRIEGGRVASIVCCIRCYREALRNTGGVLGKYFDGLGDAISANGTSSELHSASTLFADAQMSTWHQQHGFLVVDTYHT